MLSFGYNDIGTEAVNAIKIDATTWLANLRDTLSYRPSERLSMQMGIDSSLRYYSYNVTLPLFGQPGAAFGGGGLSANPPKNVQASGPWAQPGLFAFADIAATSRLHLQPGLRFDGNSRIVSGHAWWFDPRLSAFFTVGPKTVLKAAVGLYSQAPQPQELTATFGNPNLTYQRSLQYSVGVDQKLPFDVNLGLTLYDKYMYQLVTETDLTTSTGGPLNLSNARQGTLLRRRGLAAPAAHAGFLRLDRLHAFAQHAARRPVAGQRAATTSTTSIRPTS